MSDVLLLVQSLAVAFRSLQMYTTAHPRSKDAVAAAFTTLQQQLVERPRIQFVVSGTRAFFNGEAQDDRSPHLAALVRQVTERGVSGFIIERGASLDEFAAFLEALGTRPPRVQELGGLESMLLAAGVKRIQITQVRYQVVLEDDASEDAGQELNRAPSVQAPPTEDPLVKAIREALLFSLPLGLGSAAEAEGHGPGAPADDELAFLQDFHPLPLGGLGALGTELGFGPGQPSTDQVDTLSQVLSGLGPGTLLRLLAGLGTLPQDPAGLTLGLHGLVGDLLQRAVAGLLGQGADWSQLAGPVQAILDLLPDRDQVRGGLGDFLRGQGHDPSKIGLLLRRVTWEDLSLEARLVKILEEGCLFDLTLEERLAFLRELLDLGRIDDFVRVQELLLDALRQERLLRLSSAQTLAGIARWAHAPEFPPYIEGPLAEGLKANFPWEPDPPVHHWTTEALETLLRAHVSRGDLNRVISDVRELEGACAFLDHPQPWRQEAYDRLLQALRRPGLLDEVVAHLQGMDRAHLASEAFPFLEFIGVPMVHHLMACLGREEDRVKRGRLVEAIRQMGPAALPPILQALESPTWYLVRNALNLLTDIGDAGLLSTIAPLLRHPEPRVRRVAIRSLWRLCGPASEPYLIPRMKETDPGALEEVLFALGQLKSVAGLPAIAEFAQDRRAQEKLRIKAIETLGAIGSPEAQAPLTELVRRRGFFTGTESSPIRLAAARALADLGTPAAMTLLRTVLEAEPRGEFREALIGLKGLA
ncbi:HEAT repeat domain-containing protein [Geothrix campi]|uniref:HEAT repeat domain-containing protein n=1 Tax=Geothrix campi TaxID=2966450 RepID=UPI002147DACE|nr:HEAT repeat domain-containing protein [Geothrix sp. SG10]